MDDVNSRSNKNTLNSLPDAQSLIQSMQGEMLISQGTSNCSQSVVYSPVREVEKSWPTIETMINHNALLKRWQGKKKRLKSTGVRS